MDDDLKTGLMNARIIITAALAVILYIALGEEFIQYFTARVAGADYASLCFRNFYLIAVPEFPAGFSLPVSVFILAVPVISEIILIEAGLLIIRKTRMDNFRHALMSAVMLLSGYLLVYIFYSGFSVILNFNRNNDFVRIADAVAGSQNSRIIFIIFVIIIVAVYLNSVIKRILNYINH